MSWTTAELNENADIRLPNIGKTLMFGEESQSGDLVEVRDVDGWDGQVRLGDGSTYTLHHNVIKKYTDVDLGGCFDEKSRPPRPVLPARYSVAYEGSSAIITDDTTGNEFRVGLCDLSGAVAALAFAETNN